MTEEESGINQEVIRNKLEDLREYYDNNDVELGRGGTWIDPKLDLITNFPDPGENYELDLKVVPKHFDENTRYSIVELRISFDREITQHQWDRLIWDLDEAVTQNGYPEFILAAIVKSGTDVELFPEEYNESEKSNRTGEKKVW